MNGEEEERSEPRRPRVVDKRVSSRTSEQPVTTAPPAGSESPAPVAQEPPQASEATPTEAAEGDPEGTATPAQPGGAGPKEAAAEGGPGNEVWTPEREAEAQAIAEELSRVPALDWVANAAITLANVAAAKIQMGHAPDARLAIDALAALVDGLGDRFAEAEQPLRQTLAQLRMAYAAAIAPPGSPG